MSVQRRDGVRLDGLRFEGFVATDIEFGPGMPVSVLFADAEGAPRFYVELAVRATASEAREALVGMLANVSSPRPAPRARSAGIEAGDVRFGPRDRLSWVGFARDNVVVRLAGLDPRAVPYPDLARLAEATDRVVLSRPALAADAPLTPPHLARFTSETSSCRAGEAVLLDLDAPDARALHWVVGSSAQGYVEKDADGRWRLFPTKEGVIELTCHVLGGNAISSARTLEIQVADDD